MNGVQKDKPKIFIVNDDHVHREEVRLVLSSLFKVTGFEDNNAALEAMQANKPDLVFIDERMILDGKGCLFDKRNHPDLKDIPFIISGHADNKAKFLIGEEAKSDHFLVRPFTKNKVLIAVSDSLSFGVEQKWDALPAQQKSALQSTLNDFQNISRAIEEKKPLDVEGTAESCKPLVDSINNATFQGILQNVQGHHNYTYVHSLRVATYLTMFGHGIGMRGDELTTLATGGMLHDVGKTVTPQEVLNKSSKLDDREWQCMKQHVENSSRVYDTTPDITHGIRIIGEQHHEKLDGSGYPKGLKGNELNELARMSVICDIFGALTDERSYKEAFPPEMAFEILEEMDKQLDQKLVGLFKEILESHGEHVG